MIINVKKGQKASGQGTAMFSRGGAATIHQYNEFHNTRKKKPSPTRLKTQHQDAANELGQQPADDSDDERPTGSGYIIENGASGHRELVLPELIANIRQVQAHQWGQDDALLQTTRSGYSFAKHLAQQASPALDCAQQTFESDNSHPGQPSTRNVLTTLKSGFLMPPTASPAPPGHSIIPQINPLYDSSAQESPTGDSPLKHIKKHRGQSQAFMTIERNTQRLTNRYLGNDSKMDCPTLLYPTLDGIKPNPRSPAYRKPALKLRLASKGAQEHKLTALDFGEGSVEAQLQFIFPSRQAMSKSILSAQAKQSKISIAPEHSSPANTLQISSHRKSLQRNEKLSEAETTKSPDMTDAFATRTERLLQLQMARIKAPDLSKGTERQVFGPQPKKTIGSEARFETMKGSIECLSKYPNTQRGMLPFKQQRARDPLLKEDFLERLYLPKEIQIRSPPVIDFKRSKGHENEVTPAAEATPHEKLVRAYQASSKDTHVPSMVKMSTQTPRDSRIYPKLDEDYLRELLTASNHQSIQVNDPLPFAGGVSLASQGSQLFDQTRHLRNEKSKETFFLEQSQQRYGRRHSHRASNSIIKDPSVNQLSNDRSFSFCFAGEVPGSSRNILQVNAAESLPLLRQMSRVPSGLGSSQSQEGLVGRGTATNIPGSFLFSDTSLRKLGALESTHKVMEEHSRNGLGSLKPSSITEIKQWIK